MSHSSPTVLFCPLTSDNSLSAFNFKAVLGLITVAFTIPVGSSSILG